MFTGIVSAVGTVRKASRDGSGGIELDIAARFRGLTLGESIAVNGVCLTVTRKSRSGFGVRAVATTLDRTVLDQVTPGTPVNLERALAAGDRLGGHLVQGHVDGVAKVTGRRVAGDALLLDLAVPKDVARVSMPQGSITVDGVSLTVNAIPRPGIIRVSLIPFTRDHTTLGRLERGARVHVEGDLIGKYVRALLTEPRTRRKRHAD